MQQVVQEKKQAGRRRRDDGDEADATARALREGKRKQAGKDQPSKGFQ